MNFATLYRAAMRKRAAAVLTPEAEQAAVQGGMPPQGGAPMDPAMMQGGAPMDPAMMQGGMPPQGGAGPNGGQIPPEILQDQGFIQWLASQGVQLDPQSGMFIDMQSGQPLPAEAIVQAYQMYMEQVQAAQGGAPMDPAMMQGGMPPQGGAPVDPSMQGGAPVDPSMQGGAPMDPAMMQGGMPPQGGAPMDPSMQGGAPMDPAMMQQIIQDPGFMQFLQSIGIDIDPQSGQPVDVQSGQPLQPEEMMQIIQAYAQQMQGGAPGGMAGTPDQGGGEMPQQEPGMGMEAGQPQAPQLPPEILDQLQSAIDTAIQNYTAQIDKKIETLLDKLETVKQTLESYRDTEDSRSKGDKEDVRKVQEDLASELEPVTKTASAKSSAKQARAQKKSNGVPLNIFDLLENKK